MTTVQIESENVALLRDKAAEVGSPPDRAIAYSDADPALGELQWDADLTPAELDTMLRLRQRVSRRSLLSSSEWEALTSVITDIRTHRTRSNADWSAMTAAQRDTALIDWCRNLTDVLRALLRD